MGDMEMGDMNMADLEMGGMDMGDMDMGGFGLVKEEAPSTSTSGRPLDAPISTITAEERATFRRIFKDIVSSAAASSSSSTKPRPGATSAGPVATASLSGREDGVVHDLQSLVASATATARETERQARRGTSTWDPEDPATFEVPGDEMYEGLEAALKDYPESLRATAAAATVRKIQQQSRALQAEEQDQDEAALQSDQAREELERVEGMLRRAPTDMDVWEVLEREVFAPMKSLESKIKSVEHNKAEKAATATPSEPSPDSFEPGTSTTPHEAEPAKDTPKDGLAALDVIGPNYPALVLLAMRMFRHEFRSPSACLTLFDRVKSLGLMSYVLGATTALYNEMIALRWKSYADFHAVDGLLAEMDRAGIEFDRHTSRFLRDIGRERFRVGRSEAGPVMKAVWELDGVEAGLNKVIEWRGIMTQRTLEKAAAAPDAYETAVPL